MRRGKERIGVVGTLVLFVPLLSRVAGRNVSSFLVLSSFDWKNSSNKIASMYGKGEIVFFSLHSFWRIWRKNPTQPSPLLPSFPFTILL